MSAVRSERQARMALGWAMDGGDPAVVDLIDRLGAAEAWAAILEGKLGATTAIRANAVELDELAQSSRASGIRFVIPGDDEWPAGLADLGGAEPIQRRGGLPYGLWLRGPGHLARLTELSVAIVGSRASTAYGNGVAADLAGDLVDLGVTVLSGGAFGIDAAAHRGALGAGGTTVAVVANGVDVAYPPGNADLFEAVARDHLVVSELPPGAHPTRVRFLARNRLIAALTQGTVVVEAALRSGARNTAGWASACQRPVMAVPGPIYSRASQTPHLMIRNSQATLVTSAAEVMELVGPIGQHTLPLVQGPSRRTDALSEIELAVFEAVPARRRASAGAIALTAGLSMPVILASLAELERIGLVEGGERGWLALP